MNSDAKLVERLFGFQDVSENRTSEALFEVVHACLQKHKHQSKLIARCYDGASVMSGHLNGLQVKIKEVAPQAVFVHCLPHRLNLVLQQSVSNIAKCRIFFANVNGIPAFFHHSSKRTFIADTITGRRIPTAGDTRWTSSSKILNVIHTEWDRLKQTFE